MDAETKGKFSSLTVFAKPRVIKKTEVEVEVKVSAKNVVYFQQNDTMQTRLLQCNSEFDLCFRRFGLHKSKPNVALTYT